jgi:hypothetical protein
VAARGFGFAAFCRCNCTGTAGFGFGFAAGRGGATTARRAAGTTGRAPRFDRAAPATAGRFDRVRLGFVGRPLPVFV